MRRRLNVQGRFINMRRSRPVGIREPMRRAPAFVRQRIARRRILRGWRAWRLRRIINARIEANRRYRIVRHYYPRINRF